ASPIAIRVKPIRPQSPLDQLPPATIQVIDQQTLQNSTNASIADNLQDIPGVEITDNSLAGRKQIRIRGEASSRVLILIDGQEVTYQRGTGKPALRVSEIGRG
ncbi:TonB-dependent receptor plug domain-containing protein, partial [Pseudomonas aeruginosa]|uniref:TonB-dependent receptor plug domain-containing protein n=1 Tax=Pseudomonas aeruginosa TaxID=287 RepID=UPI0031B6FCE4